MRKLLALLFLLPSFACAQQVSETVEFSWTNATTGCADFNVPTSCGPLPAADAVTGLEVYVSNSPITGTPTPTFVISEVRTSTTYDVVVPNGSSVYIRLKSINRNGTSPFSVEISKVISVGLKPNAPVNLQFVVTP